MDGYRFRADKLLGLDASLDPARLPKILIDTESRRFCLEVNQGH